MLTQTIRNPNKAMACVRVDHKQWSISVRVITIGNWFDYFSKAFDQIVLELF